MKLLIQALQKADILSSASIRLTKLTGKSLYPIHPKHLIPEKLWFEVQLRRDDKVLDLGCNAGQLTLKIAKRVKSVIGLEVDVKLLEVANGFLSQSGAKNVTFIRGDANKSLPFKDNSFNKVLCSDVLEHLDKRNFALKEMHRLLKKNGLLFLVTDNPDTSWKRLQKKYGLNYYADFDHKYEYPQQEIIKVLEKKKFAVLSVAPVTYNTPLAPFIDLVGGISLTAYKKLRKWRATMNIKYPEETTGYRIIAQKI